MISYIKAKAILKKAKIKIQDEEIPLIHYNVHIPCFEFAANNS